MRRGRRAGRCLSYICWVVQAYPYTGSADCASRRRIKSQYSGLISITIARRPKSAAAPGMVSPSALHPGLVLQQVSHPRRTLSKTNIYSWQ